MKQRARVLSTIACIIMALLLVGGLVVTSLTTARVIPENPIHAPADRITLPEMLVAPDDSPGDAEGEFETTQPQEQQQQQQQTQTPTATAAPATVAASAASTSGNGSGSGSGSGTGEGTGEGGDDPTPTPVPQGGTLIETNLPGVNNSNETIYTDDSRVSNDVLSFYIRLGSLANEGDRITEIVVYEVHVATNGGTTNNRYDLEVTSDGNYTLQLQPNYSYQVAFKVVDKDGNERTEVVDPQGNAVPSSPFRYSFTYLSKLADKDNPTQGPNPPTITINFTDGQEVNAENTMLIRAEDYEGNRIAPGDIYRGVRVTIDREDWASYQARMMGHTPTINPGYEDSYDLWFQPTYGYDFEEHLIEVVAYDGKGNSQYISRKVIFRHTAEGELLATITINVMAPTVGLGTIISIGGVELRQGDNLADVIARALEEQGYTAVFERGDYLAAINCGGMCEGAHIPDDLYEKMSEQDGLYVGPIPYNGLHDLDITQGSGWVYSADGSSPTNSLGGFHPQNGSVINLIFTLAWGKDLGRTSSAGGALSSYCGSWETGSYVPNHHFENQIEITSFEPEYATDDFCARVYAYECSVCGAISGQQGAVQTDDITIEYVDHAWDVESVTDPLVDRDGQVVYVCTHCNRHKTEVIPATGGGTQP